jgi:hypothetical protein
LSPIHFPAPVLMQRRKLKTYIWMDSIFVIFGAMSFQRLSGVSSNDGMWGVVEPFFHGKSTASELSQECSG